MDTRSLQLFLHLSQSLHFGRTSQAMHISPSALTRTIQQLEEQLDTTLFIRDNRSATLTEAGKLFQKYARESVNHWQAFQQSLMAETKELQGAISIYCSVTASYSFLYDILSNFRNQHAKIGIRVHTGDPEHAIARVRNQEEDIAIAAKPDRLPANLSFKRITTSSLVMIGPIDGDASTDWQNMPFILTEKGLLRRRLDEWLQQQQVKPTIYAQVAGNEAIVSMVSLGFGIGVVPQIVLDNSPLVNKVQIIPIQPKLKAIDVGLCTHTKQLQNPVIQAFWDSLLV